VIDIFYFILLKNKMSFEKPAGYKNINHSSTTVVTSYNKSVDNKIDKTINDESRVGEKSSTENFNKPLGYKNINHSSTS
jgi:hypothetical protein